MKNILAAVVALALGFVVLDGIQVVKGPTGLTVRSVQAFAADMKSAAAAARTGRQREGPDYRQGQGESPDSDQGLALST